MAGKKTKLTKKESDFAKEYAKTGNGTQSALKVYKTKSTNTAAVIASENLRKPKVLKVIKSIADRIPDDLLVQKHLELLNVPRIRRTYIKGDLMSEIEEVDSQAIGKGLDMAYKLKKLYVEEEKPKGDTNIFIITDERKKELRELFLE